MCKECVAKLPKCFRDIPIPFSENISVILPVESPLPPFIPPLPLNHFLLTTFTVTPDY